MKKWKWDEKKIVETFFGAIPKKVIDWSKYVGHTSENNQLIFAPNFGEIFFCKSNDQPWSIISLVRLTLAAVAGEKTNSGSVGLRILNGHGSKKSANGYLDEVLSIGH